MKYGVMNEYRRCDEHRPRMLHSYPYIRTKQLFLKNRNKWPQITSVLPLSSRIESENISLLNKLKSRITRVPPILSPSIFFCLSRIRCISTYLRFEFYFKRFFDVWSCILYFNWSTIFHFIL